MKMLKYFCIVLAAGYLFSAVFPTCLIAPRACRSGPVGGWWIGRAIYVADFMLLSLVVYGIQKRKRLYWKVIPPLVGAFALSVVVPPLWTLIELSLPWVPFMFVVVLSLVGVIVFLAWWRNQKSYFG